MKTTHIWGQSSLISVVVLFLNHYSSHLLHKLWLSNHKWYSFSGDLNCKVVLSQFFSQFLWRTCWTSPPCAIDLCRFVVDPGKSAQDDDPVIHSLSILGDRLKKNDPNSLYTVISDIAKVSTARWQVVFKERWSHIGQWSLKRGSTAYDFIFLNFT